MPKISACVFVKDSVENPFMLWESVSQLIPLVDEYVIMDLGSTDGTLEILKDLAGKNPKIRLEHGHFDISRREKVFADLANQLVGMAKHELVLHHQADEIFHENLVGELGGAFQLLREGIPSDFRGLSFWRIQLENNFQTVKWYPHLINHFDLKERLYYIGDGMSTNRTHDALVFSDFPSQDWQKVFKPNPSALPMHQMILDVSMTGGFLDQIPERRRKHAPIWKEPPEVIYLHGHAVNLQEWYEREQQNPQWTANTSPFNLPEVMRFHVGKKRYVLRQELLDKIAEG